MHITYDPDHNVAYIRLRPKMAGVETIELSSEVNIDLAADGTLYGIELLNANEQLKADGNMLQLLNTSFNQLRELPLS